MKKKTVLTFNKLAKINSNRSRKSYQDIWEWTPTDWACALGGETGKCLNFVTKLRRLDDKGFGNEIDTKRVETISCIGEELADIVIYADLLATRLNLFLGDEVKKKFNKTSEKIKSKIIL